MIPWHEQSESLLVLYFSDLTGLLPRSFSLRLYCTDHLFNVSYSNENSLVRTYDYSESKSTRIFKHQPAIGPTLLMVRNKAAKWSSNKSIRHLQTCRRKKRRKKQTRLELTETFGNRIRIFGRARAMSAKSTKWKLTVVTAPAACMPQLRSNASSEPVP